MIRSRQKRASSRTWLPSRRRDSVAVELGDPFRVAVIGGGPAGALFAYFFLKLAQVVGLEGQLDIYESRDFTRSGPPGCNMCGGIVSESLVQILAAEGVNLPPGIVQRGIDAYVMHAGGGTVRIETPLHEKRIAAVYRGGGPRGAEGMQDRSFDRHLLDLAGSLGARVVRARVDGVRSDNGRPVIEPRNQEPAAHDLVVVATGINTADLKSPDGLPAKYGAPKTVRTHIREFALGERPADDRLGSAMHVFLPNLAGLEFAALIPKGDYATLCILGDQIDEEVVQKLLESPDARPCFPDEVREAPNLCRCFPQINVRGARQPFADRVVFIGDAGVTRLYKDGIGAAYRAAKAAATTAVFQGVSADDFRRHYWPICRAMARDNFIGKVMFALTQQFMKIGPARRGVLRMTAAEQRTEGRPRPMSLVLWDMFTGSAPYREILMRAVRPVFLIRLFWNMTIETWPIRRWVRQEVAS